MALEKAAAIAVDYPEAWVIGADTVVVMADEILGKPVDSEDALLMLTRLARRTLPRTERIRRATLQVDQRQLVSLRPLRLHERRATSRSRNERAHRRRTTGRRRALLYPTDPQHRRLTGNNVPRGGNSSSPGRRKRINDTVVVTFFR